MLYLSKLTLIGAPLKFLTLGLVEIGKEKSKSEFQTLFVAIISHYQRNFFQKQQMLHNFRNYKSHHLKKMIINWEIS